jgi:hypothetical protein
MQPHPGLRAYVCYGRTTKCLLFPRRPGRAAGGKAERDALDNHALHPLSSELERSHKQAAGPVQLSGAIMSRLQNNIAIVTGASSGFGRAIAMAYAAQGAKVVVSDIQEQPNVARGTPCFLDCNCGRQLWVAFEAPDVPCDVTHQAQVAQPCAANSRAIWRARCNGEQRRNLPFREICA